ncbi:MAG: hypothetical protein IJX28_00325 [Clostridia bacterium]|nr:hypothetical protein [Clostridia bacterium]
MTRREFLKKYLIKFSAFLLLAGLIVYTVYHVAGSSTGGLLTTPVRQITDVRLESGQAYLFRQEQVLSVPAQGVVNATESNGNKVEKNAILAQVWDGYAPEERAEAQARLDRLNRALGVLTASRLPAGTPLSMADKYKTEAAALYLQMQQTIAKGDWSALGAISDEMLVRLNQYGLLTGKTQGMEDMITALTRERDALLLGNCTTVQNTLSSGYFYDRTYVDGYESLFTAEALEGLTEESLEHLKQAAPTIQETATTVGKMVYGYTWYLAVELDCSASWFENEQLYRLQFPTADGAALTMTCQRLIPKTNGGCIAVFRSDELPTWFSYRRSQAVEVVMGSTEGYYVPAAALITREGERGVYIFRDSTVYFRRIEILYEGDGYCMVAENGGRDGYLDLYDIMITYGTNLYDGKVY